MTAPEPFTQLIARLGANQGAPVVISTQELTRWPEATLSLLKANGLLVRTRPAVSTVCSGCERECVMPVDVAPNQSATPVAFIVCDKRRDINRVAVPLDNLEQWQATVDAVADLIAAVLALRRPLNHSREGGVWQLGLLRGVKHAGYVKLLVNGELTVAVGGHLLALSDLLELKGDHFIVDRRRLLRAVNHPVGSNADIESASERQMRIRQRVQELKAGRVKAFLKQIAIEETLSVSRVKQILGRAAMVPVGKSARRSTAISQKKNIR
ncbi:hypothetical protein [Steroidobacter agaridevorans]|uniref:hypothetical protein n=1 Tax=Steroidobacter agaridevorans TaxID=2695856 RepID=UPI0013223949|nr:hypothetical protein [Steroidobacter agaridevorans]GFE91329.1 hypothetical protein GCM10011488_62830 [Steroidobacter agaridevorans]